MNTQICCVKYDTGNSQHDKYLVQKVFGQITASPLLFLSVCEKIAQNRRKPFQYNLRKVPMSIVVKRTSMYTKKTLYQTIGTFNKNVDK